MENSMVANKIGLLMWSTDKTHNHMLVDQFSTMEQRPQDNPVLCCQGPHAVQVVQAQYEGAGGCQEVEDTAQCTYGSGGWQGL